VWVWGWEDEYERCVEIDLRIENVKYVMRYITFCDIKKERKRGYSNYVN
jgi:hypothetical protein